MSAAERTMSELETIEAFGRQIDELAWIAEAYGLQPIAEAPVEFDFFHGSYALQRRYLVAENMVCYSVCGRFLDPCEKPIDGIWRSIAFAMRKGWIERETAVMRAFR